MENRPFTLLSLAGKRHEDIRLADCAVITIDAQEEYRSGFLALPGIDGAIREGVTVLQRARALGLPIFHIAHKGAAGAKTFASDSPYIEVFSEFEVLSTEPVIYKTLPNSFTGTTLLEHLQKSGCKHFILFGFMTHMCLSTTARAAVDHGYLSTVIANACWTRDLPFGKTIIPASTVHAVALAEIADRFAFVIQDSNELFQNKQS